MKIQTQVIFRICTQIILEKAEKLHLKSWKKRLLVTIDTQKLNFKHLEIFKTFVASPGLGTYLVNSCFINIEQNSD